MKIFPFGNNILIKPVVLERRALTTDIALCEYGEVVAIGTDVMHIKVGDIIGFIKWGVNELEINGEKNYFVSEDPRFVLGTIDLSGDLVA